LTGGTNEKGSKMDIWKILDEIEEFLRFTYQTLKQFAIDIFVIFMIFLVFEWLQFAVWQKNRRTQQ
jgi:hypothetical protein